MVTSLQHQITIDGTIVDNGYLVDYTILINRDNDDDNDSEILFVQGINNLKILKHYSEIVITRGETTATDLTIFRGWVTDIVLKDGYVLCKLRNPVWNLRTQVITETFDQSSTEAGVISNIWETVAKGEDESITVSSEDSSAYTSALTFFLCKGQSRWERAQTLRKILKWQSYYRPDTDTYYLQPEGFVEYGTVFTAGTGSSSEINVYNQPDWKYDFESIINDIKIQGAISFGRTEELFSGDTVETDFVLNFKPVDTEVYTPSVSQANLQRFGVVGSTSTFDYTVDFENQTVQFESPPASGSDNVIINYSYEQPRPVRQKDKQSISKYGIRQKQISYQTVITVDDARKEAESTITIYSRPFRSTKLLTILTDNLFPGYKVKVIDNFANENVTLTVDSVLYTYTGNYDTIEVGDKNYRTKDLIFDIEREIEKLNIKGEENQEIITDIIVNDENLWSHTTFELYRAVPDTDALYWDDDNQGIWADDAETLGNDWGDDTQETRTLSQRHQRAGRWYDDWKTDYYFDSTLSTCAYSSTQEAITFGADSTLVTGYLAKGTSPNIQFVNVDGLTYDGTIERIEASADDSTWEVINEATRTQLTSDGSILKLRMFGKAGTTMTVSQAKYEFS